MGWTKKQREQSRKERKQIAQEIKKGEDPAEIAQKYNCSLSRVCHACNEFGVDVPYSVRSNFSTEGIKILWRLLYTDQPLAMIAKELRCTLSKVNYVHKIAKREKFDLHPRPRGRPRNERLARLARTEQE